jgi:hypothetical protein
MASRTCGVTGRRSQLSRTTLLALAIVATAGLGLLASACGGSSTEGVAHVGETSTTSTSASSSADSLQSAGAAYAACMRSHGVPDFPDSDSQGQFHLTNQVPRQTRQLSTASEACEELKRRMNALDPNLAAGRRAKLQTLLRYAACMRSNGVPSFPDPTFSDGGMSFDLRPASGINPGSPVFRAAENACALPGTPQPKRRA